MILSMLLTIVFGFGVITVATIALLNVAGLRLHDLREVGKAGQVKPIFAFVYTSESARDLRESFGKLPSRLMWGAISALLGVVCLYSFVGLWVDIQEIIGIKQETDIQATHSGRDAEHLRPVNVITWVTIAGYVLVLLLVAGSISRRCYVALSENVQPQRPIQRSGT